MDLTIPSRSLMPVRAWNALRSRGPRYAWHKVLRRTLGRWPAWKRRWVYADPRQYWTLRGGDDYFREQEGQRARTLRAEWMAERLAAYRPTSILEVGCGYGKLLGALRRRTRRSAGRRRLQPAQLDHARRFLGGHGEDRAAPGLRPAAALRRRRIRHGGDLGGDPAQPAGGRRADSPRDPPRGRRFAAHNEETGLSYNRYGYDTAAWYRDRGIALAESGRSPWTPTRPRPSSAWRGCRPNRKTPRPARPVE